MKLLSGKIISTKMNKTATIEVVRFVAHPLYKKRMKRTKNYQVHDEAGHKVSEIVNFVACKPYSKTKKWKIVETNQIVKPKAIKSEKKAVAVKSKTHDAKKTKAKTKKS